MNFTGTVWIFLLCVIACYIPVNSAQRFCNRTINSKFSTVCTSCIRNQDADCPLGAKKIGSAHCRYIVTLGGSKIIQLRGCLHQCAREGIAIHCCQGHWGPRCQECPGGGDNACHGHGLCSEGLDGIGTCDCDENFTGTACEKCVNGTLYGENCTEVCQCVNGSCNGGVKGNGSCDCYSGYTGALCDQVISGCVNMSCDVNSRCKEIDGNPTCVCEIGYEDGGNGTCLAVDSCKSNPCDTNAECVSTGPAQHRCNCLVGYAGDGLDCQPIDPCQTNNGGCDANTSDCMYMAPNMSQCDCKTGYENYKEGVGCSLIDVCKLKSGSCHVNATCATVRPNEHKCTCNEGYVGNGTVCFGNILQRLIDLNENSPDQTLYKQLDAAIHLIKAVYKEPLTEHGPFTVFVPSNRGFKSVFKAQPFETFLADKNKAGQILRQHIIIGQLSLADLQNHTTFYTLQGVSAELTVRVRNDIFRYRIHGSGDRAKILAGNLIASNGMIHVTNSLLTMEPDVIGDPKKTVLELIRNEGRYNRFQTLVSSLGMESLFMAANITVFIPNNRVWDALPEGSLEYLLSDEGKLKLRSIIENHIFRGKITVADLINMDRIRSLANSAVSINITDVGQIRLNGEVNISQTDTPCRNGVFYHIESILIPPAIGDILPRRCDQKTHRVVRGSCDVCYGSLRCPVQTDVALATVIRGCRYWVNVDNQHVPYTGCARMCNRTYTTRQCCEGFYGIDCLPCRGGFQNPCNGHGICNDGFYGNGTCSCSKNFMGPACERCSQKNMFGPNCTERCSCLSGVCNDGPKGSGKCKQNTCLPGYIGDNCNRKLMMCGRYTRLCHAHSVCYRDEKNFRCMCKPGYEGDGFTCNEIDPCLKSDRGGCHIQATCTKLGPDMPRCQCDNGWVGDGFTCYPETPCFYHRDCHPKASCRSVEAGRYHCICAGGLHGNGTYCAPTNSCTIDNGGCHVKASCIPVGPGRHNCSCKTGYGGDGWACYSSIAQEIFDHPNLTQLTTLIMKVEPEDMYLQLVTDNYTFFAPTDEAMSAFKARLKTYDYWNDEENIIAMLRFHTLMGAYNMEKILKLETSYRKFDTMYDGYSIRLFTKNQSVYIYNSQTSTSKVITQDVPALNGFIHIIDKVLEPFLPESDRPYLEDFFTINSDYSLFAQWLNKTGLLDDLEDMEEYTLLAPTNQAMLTINMTVTTKFLKYYIIPKIILTPSLVDGQTEETLLGQNHQLRFQIRDGQVYVNNVVIGDPDRLTNAGVVLGITKLLHPVLNRCDQTRTNKTFGPCIRCEGKSYKCPQGFTVSTPPVLLKNECTFRGSDGVIYVGCHGLCIDSHTLRECCAGYYGPYCSECPGGPESPCNGKGLCNDGINGTGQCSCNPGFMGVACDTCLEGSAGPNCDIIKDSCAYRNGNCSEHAICAKVAGEITCSCKSGYVGNGYSCLSPCDLHNGGCHVHAHCKYENHSVSCICWDGYHGNGTKCDQIVNTCAVDNGKCSRFALCTYTPPAVTDMSNGHISCQCLKGYVGNGTMCNKDILSTVAQIPSTLEFYKALTSLGDKVDNVTDMLADRSASVTLFVPINSGLENMEPLTALDARNHMINYTAVYISLSVGTSYNSTLTSDAGEVLVITSYSGQFWINDVEIIEPNIPALNGYIHLTKDPLWFDSDKRPTTQKSSTSGSKIAVIVGPVVAVVVVLIVIAIIVTVYMYKKTKKTGFMDVWKRFRKGSDSSLSFARLNASHDEEEEVNPFQQPDNVNFNNPLYSNKDGASDSDS